MSVEIQISRSLYREILLDLRRPHYHAAERVGFLYGRIVETGRRILMIRYAPVHSDHYLEDDTVGARINGAAIREAMQSVLDSGDGVFHTHLHEWPGIPSFSPIDNEELPKLIPAFRAVGPLQAAGLFLFSPDAAIADVWFPRADAPERTERILVIG